MSKTGRGVARLIVVLLALFGAMFVGNPPASAADPGYPYASYNGPGSNASLSLWTNPSGGWYSPYSYVHRNCTDYVAWRLASLGVPMNKVNNLGHAKDWGTNAANRSLTVDANPEAGSVSAAFSRARSALTPCQAPTRPRKLDLHKFIDPAAALVRALVNLKTGVRARGQRSCTKCSCISTCTNR
jgi:hypothetical protein